MKNNIRNISFEKTNFNSLNLENDKDIKVAIYDIIEDNNFKLLGFDIQEYDLSVVFKENMLTISVISFSNKNNLKTFSVSMSSLIKLLKDYIQLCNSYYESIKSAPIQKVEALDMGRRSLHDDASHDLINKLKEHIYMDFTTARRFITLFSIFQRKSLLGEKVFI
ncbi:MAG: UPF0262 family protein [Alphaproteobacteria bacterium]